jgi:hypothetical protein
MHPIDHALRALQSEHADLESELAAERARPVPDAPSHWAKVRSHTRGSERPCSVPHPTANSSMP